MPSKYVQFQGKAKWCKLDAPDTKFDRNGKWSVDLYPIPESLERMLALKKEGIKNVVKMDDDGTYMRFSRPTQKEWSNGKLKAFNPPEILDKDGNPLPRTTRIGNGSDVTINVEVYTYPTPQKTEGVACRLASVRIDNLVPYEKTDFTKEQLQMTKGLDKVPPQLF